MSSQKQSCRHGSTAGDQSALHTQLPQAASGTRAAQVLRRALRTTGAGLWGPMQPTWSCTARPNVITLIL